MSENDRLPTEAAMRKALREIDPPAALSGADASALRQRIAARAELPLARRRRRAARPVRTNPSWPRRLIPAAAAASVAFGVWLGAATAPSLGSGVAVEEGRDWVWDDEGLLQADVSEQEFRLLVSGRADPDGLLLIAIGEI